jgi:cell division protein FtsB
MLGFSGGKSGWWILVVLILVLGLVLVYSNHGLRRLGRLEREIQTLKQTNQELREENRRLTRRLELLKKDPKAIEDEARKKLGLIRPGEKIYQLENDPGQAASDR